MASTSLEKTSSKHPRRVPVEDDDDDRKPVAKRSRGDGVATDKSAALGGSGVSLNEDAFSLVMEFLSPRELFNTAFTCKGLRSKITTRVVVRSALIHGGYAKQIIEELHVLMSKESLFVPSPCRLLRLVNGKRCEFCSKNRVNHVHPGLGVFACWDCVTRGLTKPWKTSCKTICFCLLPLPLRFISKLLLVYFICFGLNRGALSKKSRSLSRYPYPSTCCYECIWRQTIHVAASKNGYFR